MSRKRFWDEPGIPRRTTAEQALEAAAVPSCVLDCDLWLTP
jgi:hypothetical protein